ncbi:MAG: DEAD/DEAH box helicase, partial [Syntrophobacterales bacterium]|nr:DEAD/DEAH box helicase [Syntrophobacterales bacterium]
MVEEAVGRLKNDPRYSERVVHVEVMQQKRPVWGALERELPKSLSRLLEKKKMRLYSHQVEAVEVIREGRNVIITTSTASGKTLAYNLPVFEGLIQDPAATAL